MDCILLDVGPPPLCVPAEAVGVSGPLYRHSIAFLDSRVEVVLKCVAGCGGDLRFVSRLVEVDCRAAAAAPYIYRIGGACYMAVDWVLKWAKRI